MVTSRVKIKEWKGFQGGAWTPFVYYDMDEAGDGWYG